MEIPLVDLKAQYAPLQGEIVTGMAEALASMRLFLGPNTQALEAEFAAYCEVGHAVGVSDGTAALELALLACRVGPGDEVITAAHTFIATAEAIALVGARPVFVDIDPATCTIAVGEIERHIGPRTKAIIPVHLYGQPADMDPIMALAAERGLWVIEDACQAHGARYRGRRAGSLGHLAAFSFYCSKNLGAYGEGGMVTTGDPALAERVRMLRDHGSRQRYHHELVGRNARLDELQAAVLRVKLPHLDEWNASRRANFEYLMNGLRDLPGIHVTDTLPQATRGGYYGTRIRYDSTQVADLPREHFLRALQAEGVKCDTERYVLLHLAPFYRERQSAYANYCASSVSPAAPLQPYSEGDLPVTEKMHSQLVALPVFTKPQFRLLDQYIHAFRKVLSHIEDLKD